MSAEALNRAEDAEEDFLGEVERFVVIAEQIHRQLNHHALVLGDEIGERLVVACGAALHERRFAAADIGPSSRAGVFHNGLPR